MNRREFVAIMGGITVAGCSGTPEDDGDAADPTASPTATATQTATATAEPTATDTPTETQTETAAPASFSVERVDAADTVEIKEKYQYDIVVRNTGGQQGTFSSPLQFTTPDANTWETAGTVELTVPAGETRTWSSGTATFDYMTTINFRLVETETAWSVNVVSATRSFGSSYVSPDQIKMVVSSIEFKQNYTWTGSSGRTYDEPAPEGKKWAFLTVWTKNTSGSPAYLPFGHDFVLLAGNRQYDAAYISKDEGEYEGGEVQAGIVREGWIGYEVPEDLSKSDIRVAWSDSTFEGDVAVYWEP